MAIKSTSGNTGKELTRPLLCSSDYDLNPDLIQPVKSLSKRKHSFQSQNLFLMKLQLGYFSVLFVCVFLTTFKLLFAIIYAY